MASVAATIWAERIVPRRGRRAPNFAPALAAALLAALSAAPAAGQSVEREVEEEPRLRWEYFYQQRAFPFGRVPPGALQAAVREYRRRWPEMVRLQAAGAREAEDSAWVPIGPVNIPGLFIQSAGRLSAIALHPTDPRIIYVGAAQGGVWKTTDGGQTWRPLTDGECSLAMGALALDPVNPEIVYAGTGEQHFSADSYYGCGLLRSTDGGATWTQLGASVFDTPTGGARISRVLLDPTTAGSTTTATLYVASDFGLYRSTDGGTTWTRILAGVATDLVMDPTNPRLLYAALGRPTRDTANGVYRSTDGGTTWTRLTNGFPSAEVGRINLAIAPSRPTTLYAAVQDDFGSGPASTAGTLLGIWRSTDGGATWTRATAAGASCGTQCWYDLVIAVHPAGPDTVFFGGILLYRSTNGGESFAPIGGAIHVDQHAIAFDPRNPATVYVGNDGGIYRSADSGRTWTSLNTNLAITQFYAGISLHPTRSADVVLGGTQDNGTLARVEGIYWENVLGGDGGFTAIDFLSPTTSYAETQWVPNSGYSGPRRSDGAGYALKTTGINLSDAALFIPPLVMDPTNPNVLYFGTSRLYRTTDRAESWIALNLSLGGSSGLISAIAVAPSDPRVVYVGTSTGQLHRTADGGATWTLANAGLPTRFITDIAVKADDPATAYVTVSGFRSGHVFRTTDGGRSWQDISANLPDVPVNAIALDPDVPGLLVIGTDLGVFRSGDDGASWAPFNNGLPNVAVFDLARHPRTGDLVAATHGRGMFLFRSASPSTVLVAAAPADPPPLSSSARGARLPLLHLTFRARGPEPVQVLALGFDLTGHDPGAQLALFRDRNGNGTADPDDPVLGRAPAPLAPGAPLRVRVQPDSLRIPGGDSVRVVVALEFGGGAPNGTTFQAAFVPAETRTIGIRSGARDRLVQPTEPVRSPAARATLLRPGEAVALSENPIRSGRLVLSFNERPRTAAIYTLTGRLVVDLLERIQADGRYEWDLRNRDGHPVAPGVYLLVFEAAGQLVREKLIVLGPGEE